MLTCVPDISDKNQELSNSDKTDGKIGENQHRGSLIPLKKTLKELCCPNQYSFVFLVLHHKTGC